MLLYLGFHAIFELVDPMLLGAVRAAIKHAVGFHAMTDDPAPTMGAGRRQCMDGTFKTIENMGRTAHAYFKTLIVHVSAYFTSHTIVGLCLSFIHRLPLS
jgi:hypothetical protein